MKVYKEKKLGAVAGLFYSLVLWLGTVTLTVFFTLVDIFLALPVSLVLDRDARRLPHKVTNLWARGIIAWNPIWRLTVTGQSNIRKGKIT